MGELGVVEDAVEDAKQSLPGLAALLGQRPVLRPGVLADHLEDLQHAVHRRTDFVTHVGEEAGLGGVGFFGRLLGAFQFGGVDVAAEVFLGRHKQCQLSTFDRKPQ